MSGNSLIPWLRPEPPTDGLGRGTAGRHGGPRSGWTWIWTRRSAPGSSCSPQRSRPPSWTSERRHRSLRRTRSPSAMPRARARRLQRAAPPSTVTCGSSRSMSTIPAASSPSLPGCAPLPSAGLVVDVRGNGGAQGLRRRTDPLHPHPDADHAGSDHHDHLLNRDLCRQHRDGEGGIDLGPWLLSIDGRPWRPCVPSNGIDHPTDLANSIGQRYYGPVVLITDARYASATDIFRRLRRPPNRARAGRRRQHQSGWKTVDARPAAPVGDHLEGVDRPTATCPARSTCGWRSGARSGSGPRRGRRSRTSAKVPDERHLVTRAHRGRCQRQHRRDHPRRVAAAQPARPGWASTGRCADESLYWR